ncbi:MAG: PilC/PilY family type IV pilus protein [Rubrivivax sp.]
MKAAVQFLTSIAVLGGLLGSVASHATDIAELPLKASVLAKPNVVWGMDDSGSMDWEVSLDTPSGVAYWNGSTLWNSSTGKPLKSSADYSPMGYLFPLGTATGGAVYATNNTNGRGAPPIAQMAGLRAAYYNGAYYNTHVTYKPWSPAYVNSSLKTYSNASTTAAKSHPEVSSPPTLNLTVDWDSTNANFADDNYGFRVLGGMTLPVGTSVIASSTSSGICSGSTRRTLTAATTVGGTSSCIARIPYYPATFWHPTVCPSNATGCVAAPDCTVDSSSPTSSCVWAPGSTSVKLRKYEIKSTVSSYPSGRTYANEIQNFANWFSYQRKRKLQLAGSMGGVLENITGLRMGVVPFNNHTTITMEDADSTDNTKNRFAVAGRFYLNAMTSNGTPTLATLKHIGTQLDADSNLIKYACQKNSAFIVTDGFANDKGITAPSYDNTKFSSNAAPYQTTESGTLSDLALSYYINRLRGTTSTAGTLAAGLVPISSATDAWADKNPNLHLNIYAISLGLTGSIWNSGANAWNSPPTWPTAVNDDVTMIDDLWHATVNGRGKMYLATTPSETFASIAAGLNDILNDNNAQSSVAVSTVNLTAGDGLAYLGHYNAAGWSGDVTANPISAATGAITETPTWRAAGILTARSYSTRVIASHNGTAGVAFTETAVGSLVNASNAWGTTSEVMAYLRGDRSLEGTTFRTRTSLLGAVINAEPVISRADSVVYVASGEGMLHAFDITPGADAGKELWAFVPRAVLPDIGQTTARSYAFKTQLDGTPVVASIGSSSKLLVAGMGAAGRNYYALDVSAPRTNTESNAAAWVKWQFPGASDTTNQAKVGQTLGRPVIVNTSGGYRVLVTSGYNSTLDGKGRLFVLDPADGSVLKEFITADGSTSAEAGLAHVSAYAEDDGTTRYVYGGDLLGNLWRFDLSAASGSAATKVAVLQDSTGKAQPVTAAPELVAIGTQRVVLIGTGRILDVTDWGTTSSKPGHTFYAIADGTLLSPARSNLVQQTYTRTGDVLTTSPVNWSTQRGWFMDLPSTEHANTRPTIAYGGVAFVTNVAGANDCSASSYLYVIDVATGGKTSGNTYASQLLWSNSNSTGVTAVVTSKGDLRGMVRSYDGERKEPTINDGKKVDPSKNAWREVRQQ